MSLKHLLNLPTQRHNGSGNWKNLAESRMESKNVAYERIRTEGILAGICGRQTFVIVTQSTSMQLHSRSDGQDQWMGRRRKLGGFKICGMHVDLHQMRALRGTRIHAGNAGILEAKDVIRHAERAKKLSKNMRGYLNSNFPCRKKCRWIWITNSISHAWCSGAC